MAHINAHVWLLDEENAGRVLLDLGDDGTPVAFDIFTPGDQQGDPADIAERMVTLHNAELAQERDRAETSKRLEAWIAGAKF